MTLTVSRESYVKWLPSIYQRADINGRNFYRDFLWIVQHLFGSVEEILDVIHQLLRSLRGAGELPAVAGVVVGDGARGGLAAREEAAPHP